MLDNYKGRVLVVFLLKTLLSNKAVFYNPKKRPPKLQMKVLELVAVDGKVSVSIADSILIKERHHHPEVWRAFRILEMSRLIKKWVDRNPGKGKPMGKGRQKIYYKITESGLALLITDYDKILKKVIDPQKFWRMMMTFCVCSTKQTTLGTVEGFYQLFLRKYLKYSSGHGYSFQLDQFNQMCNNWIQHTILASNEFTSDQRALEILAIHPRITLEELVSKIGKATTEEIEKILSDYASMPHKTAAVDVNGNLDGIDSNTTDWHSQLHKIVVVEPNANGNDLYELSLFGVLLVQTLVRYHEMDRLKHGLHYNDISFEDYYDKISSNYQNKLPLVFGKWNLLKKILKTISAHNFGIILDRQTRSNAMAKSFLDGGNKEFYDSLIGVALHSRNRLSEFYAKGLMEFSNYVTGAISQFPDKNTMEARSYLYQKTGAVYQMLLKVNILIDPSTYDPVSFQEMVKNEAPSDIINPQQAERVSCYYGIDIIEKAFAEEITFLYFLNLHNNYRFQVMLPKNYYDFQESKIRELNDVEPSLLPMQCLLTILKHDGQIREWFLAWVEDLVRYQQEILGTMDDFYNEII
jgi:hypothetical protein